MLWTWTIRAARSATSLIVTVLRTFCYFFVALISVRECKGRSKFPNCKIVFEINFQPQSLLPNTATSKELFPFLLPRITHPVFLFGSAKIVRICTTTKLFFLFFLNFLKTLLHPLSWVGPAKIMQGMEEANDFFDSRVLAAYYTWFL